MLIDKEALKEIFEEVLNNRETSEHAKQHEWLEKFIEAEKEKKETNLARIAAETEAIRARRDMYMAVTKAAISWGIPALLTSIAIWYQTGHWPTRQ